MRFRKPKCPICDKRDKVFENFDKKSTFGKKWFCYRDNAYFNKK